MKTTIRYFFYIILALFLVVVVEHSYRQKIVSGIYRGTFPCVDCDGMDVELILHDTQQYEWIRTYPNQVIEKKGTWRVQWFSPTVLLSDGKEVFSIENRDTLELLNHQGAKMVNSEQYQIFREENP